VTDPGNDDLIVRVGRERYEEALARPGARPFDVTGRPMTGWVFVDGASVATGRALARWVRAGVECAQRLPAKTERAKRRPSR